MDLSPYWLTARGIVGFVSADKSDNLFISLK